MYYSHYDKHLTKKISKQSTHSSQYKIKNHINVLFRFKILYLTYLNLYLKGHATHVYFIVSVLHTHEIGNFRSL